MSTNLIDTVGETAASVLDGLAEAVLGPVSTLRDGTEHAGVELVGYDRSHESPSLVAFLFGSALDRGWRSIFG